MSANRLVRHHGRGKLDGRHQPVHATGSLVHCGDHGFRAVAAGIGGEGSDHPDADGKGDRQKHERWHAAIGERALPVS
jgi:hypothetical protein